MSKRRYDVTMSKRTRKPILHLQEANEYIIKTGSTGSAALKEGDGEEFCCPGDKIEADTDGYKRSLKQLIIKGDGEGAIAEKDGGRNSLGHHFTEEANQLQLLPQPQKTMESKGGVSRYVKVLRNLMRLQKHPRLGTRKTPLLQF